MEKQVRPDSERVHAERYNNFFDFIFDDETPDTWQIRDGTVIIECTCTTDPKGLEEHSWTAGFKGIWDVAKTVLSSTRSLVCPEGLTPMKGVKCDVGEW